MPHKAYIREVPGSKKVVLMIHGITGSPAHFKDLMPAVPEDWSIYNILLDGHGGDVADFGATSMKKWKKQVADVLAGLMESYEKIVIVAHSMGTLFALEAAAKYPQKVAGLFLLAVPLRVRVPVSTVEAVLRVAAGKTDGHETASAMVEDCSITLDGPLYHYISWAPRMLELLEEIKRVRMLLPQVRVPCLAFQSRKDELVSMDAAKDLARNSRIKVAVLENSGHFAYGSDDAALLRRQLHELLTNDK